MDFQGHKYIWEPYIKGKVHFKCFFSPSVDFENKIHVFKNVLTHRIDDAECELNCKPVGMKYFATLNTTVIDGTMCYHPAEYYRYNYQEGAICVNGICKVSEKRIDLFPHQFGH